MDSFQQLTSFARDLPNTGKTIIFIAFAMGCIAILYVIYFILWPRSSEIIKPATTVGQSEAVNVRSVDGSLPASKQPHREEPASMPQEDQADGVPTGNQNATSISSKEKIGRAPESFRAGDTYNVNNSGSGVAIGRVDHFTIGKQPFRMTEEVMADLLTKIDITKPVSIYAIGPSKSEANKLREYLVSHGVSVPGFHVIGQYIVAGIDMPQEPIIIGGPVPAAGKIPGATPIIVDITK